MEEQMRALMEAAELLKQPGMAEHIQELLDREASGVYCIAFLGQFSAGKSCLLNHLLGRQILPQGRRETTPLLTYLGGVKQGDSEKAQLVYQDGTTRDLSIADVSKVAQQEADDAWRLEKATALVIDLDVPLLQHGLVLLDTPGINTQIKRHELLLAESLKAASSVIYVTNGPPSSVDVDKLRMLQEAGIPFSYVRTHCDEIDEEEEDPAAAEAEDRQTLEDCGIQLSGGKMFFVSNRAGHPFFENLRDVKMFLHEQGGHARENLARDASSRLTAYSRNLLPMLAERLASLQEEAANDVAAVQARRATLERKIEGLSHVLEHHQEQLQQKVQKALEQLDQALQDAADEQAARLQKHLQELGPSMPPEQMKQELRTAGKSALRDILQTVNATMDPLLLKVHGNLSSENDVMPVDELPAFRHYSEAVKTQDAWVEQLEREIQRIRAERQAAEEKAAGTEDAQALLAELHRTEDALEEARRAYDGRDPYIPELVERIPGDSSGSRLGKNIGKLLDWATLLIPVAGEAKGAELAAKGVKAVKSGAEMAKGADLFIKTAKAAKGGVELAKEASVAQKVFAGAKDAAFLAANTMKTLKDTAKKSDDAGILDLLSLEFWGEQIGAAFDTPPHYGYDEKKKAEYDKMERKLARKLKKKAAEAMRERERMHAFRSEQERAQANFESLKLAEQRTKEELARKKSEIERNAKAAAATAWQQACIAMWKDQMREVLSQLKSKYLAEAPKRLQQYQAMRFQAIADRLQQRKQELAKLKDTTQEELQARIQKIQALQHALQPMAENAR